MWDEPEAGAELEQNLNPAADHADGNDDGSDDDDAGAEEAGAGSAEKGALAAAGYRNSLTPSAANGRLPEDKARPHPRHPAVRRRKALRGRRGTGGRLISLRRMIAEQCVPGLSGADAQTGDGGRRQVESRC